MISLTFCLFQYTRTSKLKVKFWECFSGRFFEVFTKKGTHFVCKMWHNANDFITLWYWKISDQSGTDVEGRQPGSELGGRCVDDNFTVESNSSTPNSEVIIFSKQFKQGLKQFISWVYDRLSFQLMENSHSIWISWLSSYFKCALKLEFTLQNDPK